VLENRVLRMIFGLTRDEGTGEWRKLHGKEFHDLYSSPSIIGIKKSRRMKFVGHVQMGRRGTHIGYWWESKWDRDHLEDQDEGGWIIFLWISERERMVG
jgi:hypothetical protein